MNAPASQLRMRDLVAQSGVPRTTIHYYLREGLLPAPEKSARNASRYGEEHLQRLALLKSLRNPSDGSSPLPMMQVRRAVEWVEKGVEPEVAALLQRAVSVDAASFVEEGPFDVRELAQAAGLSQKRVRELVAAGILLPEPDRLGRFDGLDLELARRFAALEKAAGLVVEDYAKIATSLRSISKREMQLRDRLVKRLEPIEAARVTLALQESGNLFHRYISYRARQHDIADLQRAESGKGKQRKS